MSMNVLIILAKMEQSVRTLVEATCVHVIVDSLERTAIKVSNRSDGSFSPAMVIWRALIDSKGKYL